jgi:hypothetical protein
MRTLCLSFVMGLVCTVVVIGAVRSSQTAEDKVIGAWSGTWDGASTGKYTMSIARDDTKNLGGTIQTVPDDGGGYTATFKSVVVDGETVTISYDSPVGDATEIQLVATTDGANIKGSWKAVDSSSKTVSASGNFIGSRK